MKTTVTVLLFSLLFVTGLSAQKAPQEKDMTKEKFQLELQFVKGTSFKALSMTSKAGVVYEIEVKYQGKKPALRIQPGAILRGEFRFETFASEGGLGTTRGGGGKGVGTFKIDTAVDAKGIKLGGCPPVCERVIDLGLAF